MNDEYLWQKTGEDPQVAELEKTLTVFRYREVAPPALTIREAEKPRTWRLVFALASLASVVIVAIVWLQMSSGGKNGIDGSDELVFINESTAPTAAATAVGSPVPAVPSTIDTAPPARRSRRREINSTTAILTRRPKTKSQTPNESIAALTAEERYAYQQLMLALSISSSKLKLVQDAINGVETNEKSPKQNNR